MIGDNLAVYNFNYLMNQALATVPNTVDKRQGSIIYDSLAPACYVLAKFYENLRTAYADTYAQTAIGEGLELRVAEKGVIRYAASYASRLGHFTDSQGNPVLVPLGSRFSTISDVNSVKFVATAAHGDPGYYALQCETLGTVGNEYVGDLLSISYINGLTTAQISDILVPARDAETDEELRSRYFDKINKQPFGGNIADYDTTLRDISGIGDVQVYPVWDGGGTVKCSIVDAEYNACSTEFVAQVQQTVDPVENPGKGIGTAPIGHTVTITTPTEVTIDVVADILLSAGKTVGQVQEAVEAAIEAYLLTVRKAWGTADDYNNYYAGIYVAKVIVAILTVADIANVSSVTLNGAANDITLTETGVLQQIPVLGTVTLNA